MKNRFSIIAPDLPETPDFLLPKELINPPFHFPSSYLRCVKCAEGDYKSSEGFVIKTPYLNAYDVKCYAAILFNLHPQKKTEDVEVS